MKDLHLLVVDDDDLVLQSVRMATALPWRVIAHSTPQDIPKRQFHAAMVDMHLSGNLERSEGIDVIRKLSQENPHLEIIAMSGDLDRELMEKSLKAGATRFLAKPLKTDELQLTLEKIEAFFLLQEVNARTPSLKWVGSGQASKTVQKWIASLKAEKGPILIEGESGTGKEVAAQLIHQQENQGPFISINVAAIPENLFESEFFGHMRGAFTGAEQNKMGLAEAAHGGDLFLDEIEALNPTLQAKLLRFLESGEVRRLGAKDSIQVKTRVIAASNRPLNQLVKEEKFREDLMWRLSGKQITLPPLRQRKEDLAELCQYFLQQDRIRRKEFSADAIEALNNYDWPGNVRELKRICEQLLLNSPLPVVRKEDVVKVLGVGKTETHGLISKIVFDKGLPKILDEYEATVISQCLETYNDIDEAARRLQISRSSLYKKIKDHQISWRES